MKDRDIKIDLRFPPDVQKTLTSIERTSERVRTSIDRMDAALEYATLTVVLCLIVSGIALSVIAQNLWRWLFKK